jgi:medium-chain acyl-[acyl-carrier-protein] hydrolase
MQPPAEDSGLWTERFRIHSYEVDFEHRTSLESLCRLFLEAAWSHAEHLGVGFHQLLAKKQFWVLSRMVIELEQYPRWGEEVVLVTWPRGVVSIFAMRDFEILSVGGRRLVGGSSAWLVLDTSTRRPQRLQPITGSIRGWPQRTAVKRDPEKLASVEMAKLAMTTAARYSDIDVNGHVNSARYIAWILDSYPSGHHRAHSVTSIELNYLGETLAGDEIRIFTAESTPGEFYHSIQKAGGHEVCRARLVWFKSSPPG